MGGAAAIVHGSARLTQDIDLVYDRSPENLERLARALSSHEPYLRGKVVPELGKGEPVIFVHGGLEDYRVWQGQMDSFARRFRVIAYSRRYNFPNQNRMTARDHSALVEAADLALLLRKLNLPPAHLIGSSYGAYTALVLAIRHPERVKTLTLAEPPVHRWAGDLSEGKNTFENFMTFWNSVGDAFRQGDPNKAKRLSVAFFSAGHDTFETLPSEARQGMLENIAEWKALTTSHDAFPRIEPKEINLLGEIPGCGAYAELLPESVEVEVFGAKCRCLSLRQLIRAKRAAGRPKDLEALAELEALDQES